MQKIKAILAVVAVSAVTTQNAAALSSYDDQPFLHRLYATPAFVYGFLDESNTNPDDTFGGQISLGLHLTDNIAIEGNYLYLDSADLGAPANGEVDISSYGFSGLFYPVPSLAGVFLSLGFGEGDHDFSNVAGLGNQDSDYVEYGAGYLQPIFEFARRPVSLRLEYRRRKTEADTPGPGDLTFRDHLVSLGVQIPLGARAKPVPPPKPAPVVPPPPPTPAPPLDTDGDGVTDAQDECAGTPPGLPVDNKGCPIFETLVLENVNFEFNKSVLTPEAKRILDDTIKKLKSGPRTGLMISGHTDSIDTEAYNLKLSRLRAQSVVDYLTDNGINPNLIKSQGFGESRPIATNSTAEGRAKNRRVEMEATDRDITDE